MRFLMLIVAMALAPFMAIAAEQPAVTEVVLANFSFTPDALNLRAGQSVTIHFVNQGSGGHDFTAPQFFSAAAMTAANRDKVNGDKGKVSLGKGESIDVTLTPATGVYPAHCSHFLHKSFGMTGKIIVN